MMKTVEAKDCGPLGEIAERVSKAVGDALKPLLDEAPELQIVFVVVPGGDVRGGAVMNGRKSHAKSMDEMMQQMETSLSVLRAGAESCGRALYPSPGTAQEVTEESGFIVHQSRGAFEDWKRKCCEHPEHGIREAAAMIATGVRVLDSLGTPESALLDLTRMCKEACRRAHTALLRNRARSHAQA